MVAGGCDSEDAFCVGGSGMTLMVVYIYSGLDGGDDQSMSMAVVEISDNNDEE